MRSRHANPVHLRRGERTACGRPLWHRLHLTVHRADVTCDACRLRDVQQQCEGARTAAAFFATAFQGGRHE